MALIDVKDLTLGYDSHTVAEHITFHVEKGDYLCIVGENGSGKTTLMRTLLGLHDAQGGTITYGDGLKTSEIGYLPQQTEIQKDFPASVREIVLSGCGTTRPFRPFYGATAKRLADSNMDRLGIMELRNRSFRELSGGQKQRVLLARALCATSKLLLLDEPVSGLDPKAIDDMYELINGLNRDGVTLIMISHDISAAVRYAKHILHIGHDVFYGTTEEYLASDTGRIFLNTEEGEAQ